MPRTKVDERLDFAEVGRARLVLRKTCAAMAHGCASEAQKRIGHLYPPVEITAEMASERPDLNRSSARNSPSSLGSGHARLRVPTPRSRMWTCRLLRLSFFPARRVKKLMFSLSLRVTDIDFTVKIGTPPPEAEHGTKAGRTERTFDASFRMQLSEGLHQERSSSRTNGPTLMGVVAEGSSEPYLSCTDDRNGSDSCTRRSRSWKPDVEFFQQALGFRVGNYGLTKWSDLFTPRQLVALTTFS